MNARAKRWLRRGACLLSLFLLLFSVLPLVLVSFHNHPYYDDFGFSAASRKAWKETGSLAAVWDAALQSASETRQNWQGTYTGTLLSNLQPGVFSEKLYFVSNLFLLGSFLLCFCFFFATVFGRRGLGLRRWETLTLTCLTLTLTLQFMPSAGEAFFWFNGGVGNLFIYSVAALAAGLFLRLYRAGSRVGAALLCLPLALCMLILGGGSYGGGLFGLCGLGGVCLWMFYRRLPRRGLFAALWGLFLACFLYSVSAPGNQARAGLIGYQGSAVKAVLQSLYYGTAYIGGYLRPQLLGVTLLVAPFLWRAAKESSFSFRRPLLPILFSAGVYCAQFTPPLYSGVGLGGWRIENTYWISFVVLWLLWIYLLTGYGARRLSRPLPGQTRKIAVVAGLCLLTVGCLGYKQSSDTLYGVQNTTGVSAWISLLNGDAARYDREMTLREELLNDESQPVVTLSPLSVTPKVFMDDLVVPGALYDVRPSLCLYYEKDAILIAEEEAAE